MSASRPDRLFRAFADETRLRILHLLSRGELCVCDIMAAMAAPQSKVSRHLGTLRRAGLVKDRKEGLWRHYSLAKASGAFHERLIGCLGACMDEVGILKRDARRLEALAKKKEACR